MPKAEPPLTAEETKLVNLVANILVKHSINQATMAQPDYASKNGKFRKEVWLTEGAITGLEKLAAKNKHKLKLEMEEILERIGTRQNAVISTPAKK